MEESKSYRIRRWSNLVQMSYKCFVFSEIEVPRGSTEINLIAVKPSAQFWGESLWPAVVLKVWDTLNIHSSVACDHTGSSK